MSDRKLFYATLAAFLLAFAGQFAYRLYFHLGWTDFSIPLCGARNLLVGADPYACFEPYYGGIAPTNPMTTILTMVPFAPLGSGGPLLLFALTVALLVYAILKRGQPWQLLIFTAAPFWINWHFIQFPVLMAALYLLPELLALSLVKPHTAIPLILTRLTRWRLIGMTAFGLLTLIIHPLWPFRWLGQISGYDGYIPALAFPASLVLLPLISAWKNERARFLLLMALVPQRWIYDTLVLWLLVKNPRQMIMLSSLSWLAYAITVNAFEQNAAYVSIWALLLIYLPVMVMVTDLSSFLHFLISKLAEAKRRKRFIFPS